MRDVLDRSRRWWADGRSAALATVVGTFRSAPRQPGASMLVGPDGEAVGSVSGGCVEGAVYELGEQVLRRRAPGAAALRRLRRRRVRRRPDLRRHPRRVRREGRPRDASPSSATSPRRSAEHRSRWPPSSPGRRPGWARAWWSGRTGSRAPPARPGSTTPSATTPAACSTRAATRCSPTASTGSAAARASAVFVESFAPPPRMIVFGAIDFAAAVREDRLLPRLPGHGVRRPPGVRHRLAVPRGDTRSSSSGRTATWPRRPRPGGSTGAPRCAC